MHSRVKKSYVCSHSLWGGLSLVRIIKPFPAMPHHERTTAPQSSLPSIPSLLCFDRSALVSCTRLCTHAEKSALAQRAWAGHRCSKTYLSCSTSGVFNPWPTDRLRPSGEFCVAREGFFTKYNALWILKFESLDTILLKENKFTAHNKILNYPKL